LRNCESRLQQQDCRAPQLQAADAPAGIICTPRRRANQSKPVQPPQQKYFSFSETKSGVWFALSHPIRGADRESSRNAGWDAVDAGCVGAQGDRRAGLSTRERSSGAQDERRMLRTAKPCGPGTRCWCQACGGDIDPTGFGAPSIRGRWRQEEFVSRESAL